MVFDAQYYMKLFDRKVFFSEKLSKTYKNSFFNFERLGMPQSSWEAHSNISGHLYLSVNDT